MSEDRPLLEMRQVRKVYDDRAVLDGLDLRVAAGEALAIVGPSGCGKSTLLNLAGGLDRPDAGAVRLEGRDLADCDDRELADLRNRRLGFVFQLHHLLPQCTALENVLVPTMVRGDGDADRARELLDRVGLGGRVDAFPGELSGGERQRLATVRALINRPALLLADEPTGALDQDTAARLADLLLELQRDEGFGMVTVTHSQALAERMGRILRLREGQLHGDGQ